MVRLAYRLTIKYREKELSMARSSQNKAKKQVETLTHEEASRKNIPTAEYEAVLHEKDKSSIQVAYERRNRDLDPQLVWRGKDEQDWSDLVVHAPPLYIQEKVHPKVLIDDLRRQTEQTEIDTSAFQNDLFEDFNGLPSEDAKTEFYQHDAHWSNRMILGDSLQVMASLAEREGLRGKVQCIYFDPPYGIKFNSNFQWSTTSRDVKDGNASHITREPEQVKAFRDTWFDGIHSYLTYLRDRLTVAHDLLHETGTVFVQIGDENVHRVRALLDEIFGDQNHIATITVQKTGGLVTGSITQTLDFIVWYSKGSPKTRSLYWNRKPGDTSLERYDQMFDKLGNSRRISNDEKQFGYSKDLKRGRLTNPESANPRFNFSFQGSEFSQKWKTNLQGLDRLAKANRLQVTGTGRRINYRRYIEDFPVIPATDRWESMQIGKELTYVVQTSTKIIESCILMATDPGDLVLDPTCGSGTSAYVSEQWGRRWITIDTSRVSLALARARIMGARYPYYLLADSKEGQQKEASITHMALSTKSTREDIRQGFVYDRVPHITLKSIANNSEIEVIWIKFQEKLETLRESLNKQLNQNWEEWEIPSDTGDKWPNEAKKTHEDWWEQRIARQKEIDASIAAKADFEYLYDKPYEDKKKVRVAGPFTVDSLSPHRALTVGADDELIDPADRKVEFEDEQDFVQVILENLKTAGVQQAHKEDKIDFISLSPWPGNLVCAEGK